MTQSRAAFSFLFRVLQGRQRELLHEAPPGRDEVRQRRGLPPPLGLLRLPRQVLQVLKVWQAQSLILSRCLEPNVTKVEGQQGVRAVLPKVVQLLRLPAW